MVVTLLFSSGDQVPVIPLIDIVVNGLIVSPEQVDAIGVKVGVVCGETITDTSVLELSQVPRVWET